ncbi:pre-toxin TG domain-containing protein [Luteimonas fraxinea]|uniref:Pre-toxin TG domain-containing protein n=1 Tax=Luteimonas fraxinea TaxID=2901869 RepID=A0ABS8UG50_9GAMM|nr:pre-toxin TG domain-containing protein [Luteimonas fraxinea]MCD9098024.1 pre-toxin TG domain-containing protein [Luteimonas fraxinea]
MAGDIRPYEAALVRAKARLTQLLASGHASAPTIAFVRRSIELMIEGLKSPPQVLAFDKMPGDARGFRGPDRWQVACEGLADQEINPQFLDPAARAAKFSEYLNLSQQLPKDAQVRAYGFLDKKNGKSYMVYGEQADVVPTMRMIGSELLAWFHTQPNSKLMATMSAKAGLATMLSERPDLVVLIRLAQTGPLDGEVRAVPIDRPAAVEVAELAIGLVPYVGNMVAAYEVYEGRDLFGYALTDVERGILGATVLLPAAGRLVKGGRALYTEARLVKLYGRDAAAWSKVVQASGRAESATGGKALVEVEKAGIELRAQRRIAGQVAKDAAPAIPALVRGATNAAPVADARVIKLLGELQTVSREMGSLDAPALLRILEKGPNVDHLKGQLLEELIESKIVPWLRTRVGEFALGLKVPAGKKLEFIPGHLIRDANGRQITDGMMAYRSGGELYIAAVFEAKAGKSAARELSVAKGSWSKMSEDAKGELLANARDIWRTRAARAKRQGQPFTQTIDDITEEYKLAELGGQVRRDIERLSAAGGKNTLQVGSETLVVNMRPQQTKFFGITPSNVATNTIEAQLKAEKVSYEMLAVDMKDTELKSLAEKMKALALDLSKTP